MARNSFFQVLSSRLNLHRRKISSCREDCEIRSCVDLELNIGISNERVSFPFWVIFDLADGFGNDHYGDVIFTWAVVNTFNSFERFADFCVMAPLLTRAASDISSWATTRRVAWLSATFWALHLTLSKSLAFLNLGRLCLWSGTHLLQISPLWLNYFGEFDISWFQRSTFAPAFTWSKVKLVVAINLRLRCESSNPATMIRVWAIWSRKSPKKTNASPFLGIFYNCITPSFS